MQITSVFFSESIFGGKPFSFLYELFLFFENLFTVIGVNMYFPVFPVKILEFFRIILGKLFNGSSPFNFTCEPIIIIYYLSCLLSSYSVSFFAFLKFCLSQFQLCYVFYYTENPIHLTFFILEPYSTVFYMDVFSILSHEPEFFAEPLPISIRMCNISNCFFSVFRMDSTNPDLNIEFSEFFSAVPGNFPNGSCPVHFPGFLVVIIYNLSSLFCSYAVFFFTSPNSFSCFLSLSDVFNDSKYPVYVLAFISQVNPAVFHIKIATILSSESIFFKIFFSILHTAIMGFYSFFPVFRMDMVSPDGRGKALDLFITISCKFFNSACPGAVIIFYIVIINELSCLFCNCPIPLLVSLKNFPGSFSFSYIFYYSDSPVCLTFFI